MNILINKRNAGNSENQLSVLTSWLQIRSHSVICPEVYFGVTSLCVSWLHGCSNLCSNSVLSLYFIGLLWLQLTLKGSFVKIILKQHSHVHLYNETVINPCNCSYSKLVVKSAT